MTRRMFPPLLFGAIGTAILIALGVWQVQRLAWKEAILAEIEARIAAAPSALPESPAPEADKYRPVGVTGRYLPGELHVLTTITGLGPGYRIVSGFESAGGRRILVDRGFVPQHEKEADRSRPDAPVRVSGTLHWPDERDGFTPPNDPEANVWYARDVAAMAEALDTEPILLVAREGSGPGIRPMPIETAGIANDHLEYALTWFTLAAIWAGMTGLLLWRMGQRKE